MIATTGLTKAYGDFLAVSDLSMEVRRGEVYGLLGPNGSGKTTTIRILLGLIRATSGGATVGGYDCWRESLDARRLVSYIGGELRLPGNLTGLNFLRYLSSLRGGGGHGLDRAVAIAERVMDLDLRRRVRNYSTGMKQKLALAQAFADPVDLLILDEPTSALDPTARRLVLELIAGARAGGQTVVFSGHVLSEVEDVADRVAIMKRGRLMHVEDLRDRSRRVRLVLARFADGSPPEVPADLGLTVRERRGPDTLLMEHAGEPGPLLSWLAARGVADLAIGLDDLGSLYNRYHGPGAVDD